MKQDGISLLLGLVLLAAVSLLAVVSASATLMQRNMALNHRENTRALENASTALTFARAWLFSRSSHDREAGCVSGCILPVGIFNAGELPGQPEFESAAWWHKNGYTAGFNPETLEPGNDPEIAALSAYWLMEEVHYEPGHESPADRATGYYRIFSRGEGNHPNSVAVVEAIVARPWEGEILRGVYPPVGPDTTHCSQFAPSQPCGVLSWRQRR